MGLLGHQDPGCAEMAAAEQIIRRRAEIGHYLSCISSEFLNLKKTVLPVINTARTVFCLSHMVDVVVVSLTAYSAVFTCCATHLPASSKEASARSIAALTCTVAVPP